MGSTPLFPMRSFARTIGFTFLVIVPLALIDIFLARTEEVEVRQEAGRLYSEGEALLKQGRSLDAVSRLKDAVSMARTNREYRLALANALSAAGKPGEAETVLTGLLEDDSTDAAANLSLGRVLVQENRVPEAISYYHRAIYGRWTSGAAANQTSARFELVDLLAKQGAQQELLAELLPLQDEVEDQQRSTHIGQLFIVAGSPQHAADVFRRILRLHPQDPDAIAGLGDAEFARGNYQNAQAQFRNALRLKPDDPYVQQRLETCAQILMLDPTRRGLAPADRYERSAQLLNLTRDEVSKCAAGDSQEQIGDLLREAEKATKRRVPVSRQSEAAESNTDLAVRLWQTGKTVCGPSLAGSGEPFALVLARVGQ